MKKVYSMPEIQITSFESEVVATSSINATKESQTSFKKYSMSKGQLK